MTTPLRQSHMRRYRRESTALELCDLAQAWGRTEAKIRDQRLTPPAVTIRYACPERGGAHDRASHGAPGCFGLTDLEHRNMCSWCAWINRCGDGDVRALRSKG